MFAGARQAEAQVGLDGLQAVGGLDQRAAEEQAEQGAAAGVEEGEDHQITGHGDAGAGDRQTAGQAVENVDEAAEDQQ